MFYSAWGTLKENNEDVIETFTTTSYPSNPIFVFDDINSISSAMNAATINAFTINNIVNQNIK